MNYRKIAPELISLWNSYNSKFGSLEEYKNIIDFYLNGQYELYLNGIIFTNKKESRELLKLSGISINYDSPELKTIKFPINLLEKLSHYDEIDYIFPSYRLSSCLNLVNEKIRTIPFREKSHLTGNGVIIGIIDSGIDTRHESFCGRILQIWDQTLNGSGTREGNFGKELKGDKLYESIDTFGHGTHVAGIAAGENEIYQGIAPKADLVVVKSDLSEFKIIAGIGYILRIAKEQSRPVIINLSLGGQHCPHDGTDPLSRFISNCSISNQIFCCAAGNEGNFNFHARTELPTGSDGINFLINQSLPSFSPNIQNKPITRLRIFGWYSGEDEIRIGVRSPNGNETPYCEIVKDPTQNPEYLYTLPEGCIKLICPDSNSWNGDRQFLAIITSLRTGELIEKGKWSLLLEGEVSKKPVDIWIIAQNHDEIHYSSNIISKWNLSNSHKIGTPGASNKAITVGAFITRTCWESICWEGRTIGEIEDNIAQFSNPGPLRDSYPKPDIIAPGSAIIAPMSCDSMFPERLKIDDNFVVLSGTSMAAPVITGVIALLMEKNYKTGLTPEEVKEWLIDNCYLPDHLKCKWDIKWGWGLIRLPLD